MAAGTVYLIVFDDFADWQVALACREIRNGDSQSLRVAGLTAGPVTAASGLRVEPDGGLDIVNPDGASALIVPGGPLWEQGEVPEMTALVRTFRSADIPIAAIGSATVLLARAGLFASTRHTSNGLAYLRENVPDYGDEAHYVNVLDVADGGLITAHEAGSIDFTHEIIKLLELYDEPERRAWFRLHKEGALPANA